MPPGTPEPLAELAASGLEYVRKVLAGEVLPDPTALKAAKMARDEVCGPIAQKVEASLTVSFAQLVEQSIAEGGGG